MAIELATAEDSVDMCDSCELKKLPGVSHWVQQEKPKEVNAFMREFLKK